MRSTLILLRALRAVSTSPPMREYPRYVEAVNRSYQSEAEQPDSARLYAGLRERAARQGRLAPTRVGMRGLVSALVSFVDDYPGPFPAWAFDDLAVRAALDWLGTRPAGVTIPDLLDSPICRAQRSFLESLLVVHATLRQLARGRDDRALPSCRMSLGERLRLGSRIVPFARDVSRGGDPLGDAYHYAANVAIGCAALPSRPERLWAVPLFLAGPELMTLVRQEMFGSPLFFGNHARIDRMGLAHGQRLAWTAQDSLIA